MVVTIHGNVCLCINLSGEDIFEKNIFGNQNLIFRMFAVKLC